MKPAPFEYVRARSTGEALDALAANPEESKVLAGGQSLVPVMNFRLAAPQVLVDINAVPDLDRIDARDQGVAVGATARQADVERSGLVRQVCPLLAEAVRHIGHPQLRNRGTVVGSLTHADPSAELPAVALALGAVVTVAGQSGQRQVPAEDFFTTVFTTDVADDEIATQVWFPGVRPGTGTAFVEIARRPGDFAMVGVAATLTVTDGVITDVALAASGVGDRPHRLVAAEQILVGAAAEPATFTTAGDAAGRDDRLNPSDDVHATAWYRRRVLSSLVERALTTAATRATTT